MGTFADLTDDGFSASSAALGVRLNADTAPDKAAETMKLARRYNLPPMLAEQFAEDYKARAQTEDAHETFKRAPRLGSWIAEQPERAKVASDDLETLGGIDVALRTLKNIPGAIASGFPSASAGMWGALAAPFEVIGQGMQAAENAARGAIGLPAYDGPQPGLVLGGLMREQQRTANAVASSIYTAPKDAGVIERGIGSGFQSATQTVLTLPLALQQGGANASLAVLSAVTGGQSYGKARDQGQSPVSALAYGAEDAVAEFVTEKLPFAKLLGDIKAGTSGAKMLVNNLVREVPGEMAATVWQNFNEWANLNPDKSVKQWLDEQPAALAETVVATLVGGGAQVGAIKAVQTGFDRLSGRAQKAEQDASQIEALAKLADASKLRGRDAQTFRELVAHVAEEQGDTPTEFYVDGEILANTLNQSGMTIQELEAIAPVVASQISAAMTGGDIRIPVSEFMVAGDAITAPLIDHLRTAPEAMSRAEAQEYIKTESERLGAEFDREMQTRVDRDEYQRSIEDVRKEFQTELDSTKRFTTDVNRAYADLLANFYGATAARLGMKPSELLERYRLRVQSSVTGGAKTMDQGAIDETTGLPLNDDGTVTVYHHTSAEKAAQIKQSGVLQSAGESDLYFTTTPNTDTGYGDTAVPFRVKPERLLLDDEFPDGRQDFRVEANNAKKSRRVKFRPDGEGVLYQGEIPRAQISLGDDITASPSVISLLAGADLTSFIHESGHFFLEVQADLAIKIQQQIDAGASVTDGERAIVADMNRLLDWFGVKGNEHLSPLGEWSAMTLDEKRQHHEQFARGFEAFAFEGKSPSIELQGIFQRFRSWLMQVYKTLRSLNVELTDDVRAVMGRMIATDFAIEEAEAQRNMGPLFRDVGKSGMTLEEFNAYQALASGATEAAVDRLQERSLADMKWLGRARDKALKARQQAVEEQRREVRQEVRSEVLKEPVYRAWKFLTNKGDEGDTATAQKRAKQSKSIDRDRDNMFTAIAKLGGLNRDELEKQWGVDPADMKAMQSGVFGMPVARKDGGMSIDAMLEALSEEGYLLADENGRADPQDFEAKFDAQRRGQDQFSVWRDMAGEAPVQALGEDKIAGKLNTAELREQYGAGENAVWRKLSARRMTSDSGISPDIVAETFGFDSGDALVKALAEAVPPGEVIEARTDQRMLEMFGDITSPEALERAADEAVHNEARARFIAAELKALQDANTVRADTGKRTKQGRAVTTDVLTRAAKEYAQEIVSRQRVRDLRPAQYASAEARSAKLAEKAFAAGKLDEAAMHKRNQLVNHFAAKAAFEAQAEVKKHADYFRKFEKRPASVDPGYLDQIDGMLERFDFKPVSLREVDRRKSLREWYDEQVAMGNVPAIPDALLDESSRKSYKDMTVEELRGLRDAVRNIEHLGRLKNKLMLARDKRTFDAIASEMADTIVKNGGDPREVKLEGDKGIKPWFEGIAAMHRKLSSLFRQMDGGKDDGPLYEYIGRAMNERGAWEDAQIEQATVKLRELYRPLTKMRGGITGARSKLFIPEINASLTRGGRLAVALNWGNADNRQRIMDGDKWSEGQVRAILSTLTAEELAFVNGTWEFLDSYWPEIAAKEKRLTGVEPEKVKAEPFNVRSADGVDVAMRGGYYPLKYDTDRSDRADTQEAAQVAKEMMRGAMTRATTRRGHTKERLQEVKRAVRKDLNVITQHVTQVVHDLAWHEWLIDTNRLVRDDRVVDAIRTHYGPKVLKTIRDDIAGIATADVVPQTDLDKALLLVRSNVSRATMGASLTTAFLQPFGLTQSMSRIGAKHVLRGGARWVGDAARMESTIAWIQDKSEFMRLRNKTFNRELREISGTVGGKSAAMQAVDGGLFWLMQKMQLVADVPTWVGQYEKSIAEGLDDAAAVAQADRAVIEAQGSGQTKDMAEIQRKHPMLTQFYSYFSVTLNLVAEKTATTDFKNPRAVAGWLGDMALLVVIPAIMPALLMDIARGGDDDEEGLAKKIAKWQIGYLMGMVVGIREGSGMLEGFDYAGPPVGRIVGDIGKAAKQTAQGEIDEGAVLAYARLIGTAFGLPVTQVIRSYKGWKAWDEGEAPPQAVLLGPPPKQ